MADHLTVDMDSDEGDYTDYATDAPLPTPSGTPYRTPHPSRHHSRHATPSPTPSPYPVSSSPPTTNGRASPLHRMNMGHQQQHHHHHPLHHQDRAFDESISILDPRRFTPTLHANLVAEILSLRRELESKSNLVDTLEQDLHAARNEHETAATSAVTAQREARDIKRQLARAENDDAVEAVAKERDEAVNAVGELKRQVERLTKSRRSAEEDVERIKKMADQEQEEYEASKRVLERRAHIAEGRLKALLDELATANEMPPPPPPTQDTVETDHEDVAPSEIAQSDAASTRNSMRDSYKDRPASWKMGDDEAERLGIRFSVAANTGMSLADELNFDEEDENDEEEDDEGDQTEAEFSFAEENGFLFGQDNASDSGMDSELEENEEECEMTEYHEMGVQVDFDDTQDLEEQVEQEQQLHQESEQQSERLDVLGLEIEEKLAELERTYAELDRKTIELDSIYNAFDKVHDRVSELEEQIEKMDQEAAEGEKFVRKMEKEHAEKSELLDVRGQEVEVRWTTLQARELSLGEVKKALDKRSKNLDELEALVIAASTPIVIEDIEDIMAEKTLEKRSQDLDERKVYLDERETILGERKTTLDEREATFDERATYLGEQQANLNEQATTLNERATSLEEQATNLEERAASLNERQTGIDELKVNLDAREASLGKRERSLDERERGLDEREKSLDERERSLDERERSLDEREGSLDKVEKTLGDKERSLEEREELVIAASTPIITDNKETETELNDARAAEIEAKEREGEYEANERRKRSRSTVSSPTPFSSPVATFTTPAYVSVESQTTEIKPSYTSAESQTTEIKPLYTSTESQTTEIKPSYTSVESQTTEIKPSYTSVESQTCPPYVSVEAQTSSSYVSVESQTSPPYVSVESQVTPVYVSAESQVTPVYVSAESQVTPLYVSVESQAAPVYASVEAQITPVYVSTESQTDEPPAPPIPPRRASPPPPVIQTQTVGVQTDPMRPTPPPLIIPTIAVIPPPPTPPLPPPPKPIMKNAAVQTRSMPRAKSRAVQTEEIGLEEKIRKLPPHLHPAAILANNPIPPIINYPPHPDAPPPSPPKKSARRSMVKRTSAMGPTSAPVSAPAPRSVPAAEQGPGSALIYSSPPRVDLHEGTPEKDKDKASVRRHLFNGLDLSHDLPQSSGDDEFPDDADLSGSEFKTALSAPKPKKTRNNPHINLSRPSPVETSSQKPTGGLQRKGATIRKTALISSGSHAHNRARSPSFESNRTSESGGTTKIGPPFPVPARHSSRKPGGYGNQTRNESPTPMSAGLPRRTLPTKHTRQQSIRKVRSATALPNIRTSNGRGRSPPPLSASSAAPDSPGLPPPLPRDEVLSPFEKPKAGTVRHKHQESTNTSNSANTAGTASVGSSIQQTSVVDAIAQTMVGEWMWKYVRRRKSFGVTESPQNWDGRDESGGGQRHKRWVWLAPYERAVMWSSRQPTSGNALLGKSGRKRKRSILQPPAGISRALDKVLTNKVPIQSVLDVKDDTPLPKGADPSKPLFNRSILILTPARALKFTAPNRERHYVWLTALSFLSHSPQGSEGLLALPPPMPFEYEQVQHQKPLAPPTQRPPMPPIPAHRDVPFHPVRDSIRLAKGKSRQRAQKPNPFPPPRSDSIREVESIVSNGSVAEPPSIPRFPGQHTRKRSNSAVRPGTQRSISNGYDPSILSSYGSTNGDYYGNAIIGVGGIGIVSGNSSMLSGHPPPLGGWETGPIGTVRMEAFVERQPRYEFDEEDEYRRPSSYRLRRDHRSSRRESYWSGSGDFYAGSGPGPVEDDGFWRGEDPFGGF